MTYQQKKSCTDQDKIQELNSLISNHKLQDTQHKVLERKPEKMLEKSEKESRRAC